ncbi:MAG: acyltransferase [Clostridiales bacterium]|nr:acyltransferase [Clostridiales bacterium]
MLTLQKTLEQRLSELEFQINRCEEKETTGVFNRSFHALEGDCEEMKRLRTVLSGQPCLWGDPARLHIAATAAVFPCFFNTNSGHITIGDYTFAGSDVSILAGSHDKNLTGLLRRDLPLGEGCDIVIGSGVWLASACTVLGPCTIGDNAVIAAGSLVTPGTVVPPNTVYGGNPAQEIKKLDNSGGFCRTTEFFAAAQPEPPVADSAVGRAFERANGLLYVKGWYAEERIARAGTWQSAHRLYGSEAELYYYRPKAEESELVLVFRWDGADELHLCVSCGNHKKTVLVAPSEEREIRIPVVCKEQVLRIDVSVTDQDPTRKSQNGLLVFEAERKDHDGWDMEEINVKQGKNCAAVSQEECIFKEVAREICESADQSSPYEETVRFEEIPVAVHEKTVAPDQFYDEVLSQNVQDMNTRCMIEYYRPLEDSGFKRFIKRVIRKILCFLIHPLTAEITQFNIASTASANSLYSFVEAQQLENQRKDKRIEELERRINSLEAAARKE